MTRFHLKNMDSGTLCPGRKEGKCAFVCAFCMGALLPCKEGFLEFGQIDPGQVSAMFEVILQVFEDDRLGDGVELIRREVLERGSLSEEFLDDPLDVEGGLFARGNLVRFHIPDNTRLSGNIQSINKNLL